MKWLYATYLLLILAFAAGMGWVQWQSAAAIYQASTAMQSASHSFIDRQQAMDGQQQRIGVALGQLERDMIRLRNYLKKKGEK
jgi:hypothetical protein